MTTFSETLDSVCFWTKVKREEIIPTFSALVYFFLIITSYYVLKPIRESLALEFGAKKIPGLSILSMFSLVLGQACYSAIIGYFPRKYFIPGITLFFVATMIFFSSAFSALPQTSSNNFLELTPRKIFITAYFIWVNIFSLFSVTMFWSFINDSFTLEQGKRVYGIIGLGGVLGGLTGGIITVKFVERLGIGKMILVAAMLLLPTIILMHIIDTFAPSKGADKKLISNLANEKKDTLDFLKAGIGFKTILNSQLLFLLALEMFAYTFYSSIFSFQIQSLLEKEIPVGESRTKYWAETYTLINFWSLIIQTFFTTWAIRVARPWLLLLLIAVWQLGGSILLLVFPSLSLATSVGIVRYAMNYSLGRSVRELFYTLVSKEEKYQGKSFIDTLVFRSGDGLGSAFVLSWVTFFSPVGWLDGVLLAMVILSSFVILKLGVEFQNSVTKSQPA